MDRERAAGDQRRLERRPARRRRTDPAARAVRRCDLLGPPARHGALREVRARGQLERRVRLGRRPRAAGLAAGLLALPPRARGRGLPGRAVHGLRRRHPGRPAARAQAVRRPPARHHQRAPRAAAPREGRRARLACPVALGRALGGHPRVHGEMDGPRPVSWNVTADGASQTQHWFDVFLGTPLAILGIVICAIVARFVLHRVIDKVTDGIVSGRAGIGRLEDRLPSAIISATLSARREQRARTMASVLKSLATAAIGTIAALMILDQLGVKTGPLLASLGIVGIAVGFGAQALVRDVISGIFMLIEDQYGVGDVVDLGDASGVVEAVGRRVTRVRDVDGTVWYIRNGQVLRVGNRSQGWARAVLDVGIAYGEDVTRAEALLLEVAQTLRTDEKFGPLVLEEPEMWGVESVTADGVVLRLVVKTEPLEQWTVARELRRRIKERLDAEGVQVAHPQSAVWVAGDAPVKAGQ